MLNFWLSGYHCFNTLTNVALVWNKFVGELVMNASALYASQSADDQAHFLSLIINTGSLSTADHF